MTGLIVCALLGVLDVVAMIGVGMEGAPPLGVALVGGILGLITVAAAVPAWQGSRAGLVVVIASRAVGLPLGLPVYFVDEAPNWVRVVVATTSVATLVCVGLLSLALRRPPLEASV
jgi:hypothetical protein